MPEQAHLSSPEASGGNDRKGKQRARDDSLDLSAIQNLSIEEQLENAMRSSLVVSAGKEITGTARVTLPRSASSTTSHSVFPALDRKPSGAHITRPISLAHAPKRRRSDRPHPSLERKRSASVTSVREALAGDPLAWLRQSVQEQRAGQMSQYSPSLDEDLPNPEQPSTPTSTSFTFPRQAAHRRTPSSASAKSVTSTTTTSPSPTKKFDYSGAILLSFISGQGPVQKRVQEHARRSSVDAPASPTKSTHPSPLAPQLSSFESTDPSHPAIAALEAAAAGETPSSTASEANQTGLRKFSLPSLSSIQAPSFPKLPNLPDLSRMSAPSLPSMPSMPKFEAPTVSMPRFSTPELPNAREWLPDAWTKGFGMRQGEDPSKKFMDEEDQAEEGEPDWARIKDKYEKPKLPLVFLHGLFGFSVLGPANVPALQIQYWRGVREALEELGVEVLMTSSPASGNIETRAKAIAQQIHERFEGREINIIGHSMGGLDARYLITHLAPLTFTIRSMTTIATPHRGSPFADYLLDDVIGRRNLPSLLNVMNAIQLPGGGRAFEALTLSKMERFNEETPNDPETKYYSYGAQFRPSFLDVFRLPWSVIFEKEGENDGLVSVSSAQWGEYLGTLENVNHLDLVGWVGRVRYAFAEMTGKAIKFKPYVIFR
ncbi:lipase 2 [Cystobasidiomycetes sp. EMM_F5]